MPVDQLLLFVAAGLLLNLTPGPDVLYVVSHALRSGTRSGVVAALGITAGCFVHIVAAALGVSALMAASATAFTVLKWIGALYLVYVGLRLLLSTKQSATFLGADYAGSTGAKGVFDIKNGAEDVAVETDLNLNLKSNLKSEIAAHGLASSPMNSPIHSPVSSAVSVFAKGFATNALNPKVALFFLAFLPQFIAPTVVNKPLAFFLLGLLFTFNGMWVNIGWAVATDWLMQRTTAQRAGAATRAAGERGGLLLWLDRVAGTLFIAFGLKLALTDNLAS